jgi:hypothetical protein
VAAAGVQAAAAAGEVYVSVLEGLGQAARQGAAPQQVLTAFKQQLLELESTAKR